MDSGKRRCMLCAVSSATLCSALTSSPPSLYVLMVPSCCSLYPKTHMQRTARESRGMGTSLYTSLCAMLWSSALHAVCQRGHLGDVCAALRDCGAALSARRRAEVWSRSKRVAGVQERVGAARRLSEGDGDNEHAEPRC